MKKIAALFGILVVTPIWYYLLYQILVRVNASELMFFLYWVYLPAGLLATVIGRLAEKGAA